MKWSAGFSEFCSQDRSLHLTPGQQSSSLKQRQPQPIFFDNANGLSKGLGLKGKANCNKTRRIAIYSHDSQGLGHLRRNTNIANILSDSISDTSILLICGSRHVGRLALPDHADVLVLPAISKDESGLYSSKHLDLDLGLIVSLRSNLIREALNIFSPDLFIVDKVPWGFQNELAQSLDMLRDYHSTTCVLGVRDVMDEPIRARQEWKSMQNDEAIRRFYDQVWIYGDPALHPLHLKCDFSESTTQKAVYTGYINPRDIQSNTKTNGSAKDSQSWPHTEPYVLCLVGGGQDGYSLANIFAHSSFGKQRVGVIITGPYMPRDHRDALYQVAEQRHDLYVYEFLPDTLSVIRKADRVVSLGGYNSVVEIISCEKPALIVPRTIPRQEQLVRAQALQDRSLANYILLENLNSELLSKWINMPWHGQTSSSLKIDFSGVFRIKQLSTQLLALGREGNKSSQ